MKRKWLVVAFGVAAVALGLIGAPGSPFSPREKAYYADPHMASFIRPGLEFKITKVTIGDGGLVTARFQVTDPRGVPLDREGITTPGAVATSFVLARIPKGGRFYQAYTKRTKTSTYPPAAGQTARQASADTGGRYVKIADGEYDYVFGTRVTAGYEASATHSVGIYGSRNLTEFDLGVNYASAVYRWTPDGSPVVEVRDVIDDRSCNACHDEINFHGGSRRGLPTCVLCHTPAYEDVTNVNPETGNTIDMRVMIHKIHMGSLLPSVASGTPYRFIGNRNAVHDYSKVHLPSEPNNCAKCHETGASQSQTYLTTPTRAACGACHDNVNFATGENHANGLPQFNDNNCARCHQPQGETDFDASIKGAHVHPQDSSLIGGVVSKIIGVENTSAGQRPTVHFSVNDRAGNPLKLSDLNRIAFVMAGPTSDYGDGLPTKGGYVSESAANAQATANGWRYTFNQAIPEGSKGTFSIAVEARRLERVLAGTLKERAIQSGSPNDVVNFSVDGSATAPRRKIVDLAKCNDCHRELSVHGENRNSTEYCVICHNPRETDVARRPAAANPSESVDFGLMIHRIHAGDRQSRDYTIYGFGGTPFNFNHVRFPGALDNCANCHLPGTQNVPVSARLSKTDPRGPIPAPKPATAACLGCHTSVDAASHALVNTSEIGESCAVCHGPNASLSVDRVHAR
ncbi:MAG: OmcA/MtrC family decaheme c-type cytochrome [Bryobacteraceae bacterium]|nr:OmcA/MtrC family decaheme c-type cytochrome [Bryobacteraceae bacterium]